MTKTKFDRHQTPQQQPFVSHGVAHEHIISVPRICSESAFQGQLALASSNDNELDAATNQVPGSTNFLGTYFIHLFSRKSRFCDFAMVPEMSFRLEMAIARGITKGIP